MIENQIEVINSIEEDKEITIKCDVDQKFEWCSFKHENKTCEISFIKNSRREAKPYITNCTDFEGRAEISEHSNSENIRTCSINLSNVSLQDSGIWTCEIERFHGYGYGNGYGTVVSRDITVNVASNFEMITKQTEILNVIEGDKQTIECEVNHEFKRCSFKLKDKTCEVSIPEYAWGNVYGPCNFEDRIEIMANGNKNGYFTCSITFDGVTLQDDGIWTCEIQRLGGFESVVSRNITLNVDPNFNLIENQNEMLNAVEGGKVDIKCEVDHRFEWCSFMHKGKICDMTFGKDITKESHSYITNCDDFDNRAVMSEFVNTDFSKTCSITLSNVTLEDDGGIWTCEIERFHGHGKGYGTVVSQVISVNVSPNFNMIEKHTEILKAVEGEKLEINCKVDHKFEWCSFKYNDKTCEMSTKNDINCIDFEGRAEITSNSNTCSLILHNSTLQDNGIWTCEIERYHGYGHGRGYGTVVSQDIPVNISSNFKMIEKQAKVLNTIEGDKLNIKCEVNHDFEWCSFKQNDKTCKMSKKENVVKDSDHYSMICENFENRAAEISGYGKTCSLTINNATLHEEGIWTCEIKRSGGYGSIVTRDITINVSPNFNMIKAQDNILKTEEGGALTIICNVDHRFEWCSFKHMNKFCEMPSNSIDAKDTNCQDFQNRAQIREYGKICSLTLTNATLQDVGIWTCDIERFHGYGHGKGYGTIVSKDVTVEISSNFNFIENKVKVFNAIEGDKLNLKCKVDHKFEWCSFKHKNKTCEKSFKENSYTMDCEDFEDRAEISETCSITLNNVTLQDDGNWICEIERFHGYGKGYGTVISQDLTLNVLSSIAKETPIQSTGSVTITKTINSMLYFSLLVSLLLFH